ncbi:MAG: alpha/beta fold hydrolase [Actinobacteria bacterium]|nr:alpha/beta fold hydrolase [Actinomycetota bacterium]
MYATNDVEVDGRQIRYYRAGEGNPRTLLFLHGSGPGVTALANWSGAITRLSDDFDCIAPDILGFGDSYHPDEVLDAETMLQLRIESLVELTRTLNLESVDLVGNSMGGRISLALLLQHPDVFRRATLMGTGGVAVTVPITLSRVRNFYDDPSKATLREMFANFLHNPAALGDLTALADERFEVATRDDVRRSHLSTFNGGPAPFDLNRFRTLAAPVSLVHGREDKVVPVQASLSLLEVIPHADAHIIGECGHWLQLEKPAEFDALIRSFHSSK